MGVRNREKEESIGREKGEGELEVEDGKDREKREGGKK